MSDLPFVRLPRILPRPAKWHRAGISTLGFHFDEPPPEPTELEERLLSRWLHWDLSREPEHYAARILADPNLIDPGWIANVMVKVGDDLWRWTRTSWTLHFWSHNDKPLAELLATEVVDSYSRDDYLAFCEAHPIEGTA